MVSSSEKLLGAGEIPAVQHVVLGIPVLLPGSSCNPLAKASSCPAPSRNGYKGLSVTSRLLLTLKMHVSALEIAGFLDIDKSFQRGLY